MDPELQDLIDRLSEDPERDHVVMEIQVLQSIFGDDTVKMFHPSQEDASHSNHYSESNGKIRYEVTLNLSPHDDVSIRVLVTLPSSYPASSPPQLQLLSRYIGAFGVDSDLFGAVLKTYMSITGVEFIPDTVCVFDGLQNVLERCVGWYEDRLTAEKAAELMREDLESHQESHSVSSANRRAQVNGHGNGGGTQPVSLPPGVQMFTAEPITDRKSSFVGRSFKLSDPSQVPDILNYLMSDRRIARAAHPIINAWKCQVGNVLHQDNDDDDETAAGGRIAHLLHILEVNNVLVVVTRYWGGILLGPDRFKHINQAARNALEMGGFLDTPDSKKNTGRGKRRS
ncbi:imprinted and ancient [Neolentinus lepideus HHB14362 ss-1]|uniref:Imprinted and ancient n=1 Tax=Neolentinus lepideus HHB14362 ss-1 TaxID=1314782 RepID=A0A165VA90_9AGAM|nr:imprinted and ancient [Neolentinus lepideus HHB14362 ss-1]